MQPVGQPVGTPYPPSPPASTRPKWAPVAISCGVGCVVLAVIALVGIGLAVKNATGSTKQADVVARQFMALVSDGKLQQAYSSTAKQSSMKDFESFAGYWRQHMGKLRSAQLVNQRWFGGTGGPVITLYYELQGTAHAGRATATIVEEGGTLKVGGLNYQPGSGGGL